MKCTQNVQFPLRGMVVALLGLTMVACGGGGGGGGPAPVVKLDLSPANQDSVSHAVVGGALGMGGADRPVAAAGVAVAQRRFVKAAHALKANPMAIASQTFSCAVSGSYTVTIDDRDNNSALTTGDVVTLAYAQCKETANLMIDGTTSMELTNVLSSTDFDARDTFTRFATQEEQAGQVHRYTLDGTMLAGYREQSATRSTMRLTADGEFTVGLVTPVFTDTVTLRSGFAQDFADDTAAVPPSGSGGPGRSAVIVTGDLMSANAGGWVAVKTDAAVVAYAGDPFPREGILQVNGQHGEMHLTVRPDSLHVQRDLDHNDDGAIEVATEVHWDWLV